MQRLLRLFFRLLYHQFAWTYDLVAALVSVGMWKEWVYSVIPEIVGSRVLELGHGPGHLQKQLAERGLNCTGLDASPQMGRLAYRRLPHPRLVRGFAQALPFPSRTYTTLIATFPAEYIREQATLREAYRVLKPGGRFIILSHSLITGRGLVHRFAAWLFQVTGQSGDLERSLQTFEHRLHAAGFLTSRKAVPVRNASMAYLLVAERPVPGTGKSW